MTFELIIIATYILLQIGIGIWAGRSVQSSSDFLLAGRSLGTTLTTFTVFCTWYGVEATIGSAGNVFTSGLTGARVEPFGYTIALLLCGLTLAHTLRARRYVTLADFFADRFGRHIEKIATLILIPSTLIWTSAQILALGHILATIASIPLWVGLTTAILIVVIYASYGGLLASVYTDFFQAVVLMIGMIALLGYCLWLFPGEASQIFNSSTWNRETIPEPFWFKADAWAIPILGSLTSHELISRLLATKTPKIAKRSSLYAAALYLSFGLIPVALGLMGPSFALGVTDPDQFLPSLAQSVLPGPVYLLFIAAMISAILSTADSALITVTGLVTQNLLPRHWSPNNQVFINRIVLILSGLVVLLLACDAERIYDLLILASSTGTAGILVCTFIGLWSPLGGKLAAGSALVVGVLGPPLFEYLGLQAPFLATILSCLLVYGGGILANGQISFRRSSKDF